MVCYMTAFPVTNNKTKRRFGHVTLSPFAIDYIEGFTAPIRSPLHPYAPLYYLLHYTVQIALTGARGLALQLTQLQLQLGLLLVRLCKITFIKQGQIKPWLPKMSLNLYQLRSHSFLIQLIFRILNNIQLSFTRIF